MPVIKLTKNKIALVSNEDSDYLNQWKWYAIERHNLYYATRTLKHIDMHRVIGERMGLIGQIDHKSRNSLDNQRENLRLATQRQNCMNRSISVQNTSGYKGVSWDKVMNKWRAYIMFERVLTCLGFFDDLEEAAEAYNIAAIRLFGEFAALNIITTSTIQPIDPASFAIQPFEEGV